MFQLPRCTIERPDIRFKDIVFVEKMGPKRIYKSLSIAISLVVCGEPVFRLGFKTRRVVSG